MINAQFKDSGKDLSAEFVRKRSPGEIITPLHYTNDVVDFDHWDHLFVTNCCKNLTLHRFDSPPTAVLDLGCGRGLWAIEAARQWQGATIVGFDIAHVQPPLVMLKALSKRLKWVHGNLLDGLPFKDAQFDFVRMVRMGMHVPIDEWRHVLEDVSRILKPNGVLEIVEEDLLFPGKYTYPLDGYPVTKQLPSGSSPQSSNTTVTTMSSPYVISDSSFKLISLKSSSGDAFSGTMPPVSAFEAEHAQPRPPDPRDHSRLRRAWEEMLDDCLLTSNLLPILQSQLEACFDEIRTHPPLQIPLPQTSFRRRGSSQTTHGLPSLIDPDALFELSTLSDKSAPANSDSDWPSLATRKSSGDLAKKSSQRGVSSWASMHLARTVQTITGCKGSIWRAYEKLYEQDRSLPPIVRTAQEKYIRRYPTVAQSPTNPLQERFEQDWTNWVNDMADRTSLRSSIRSELSWNEPYGGLPEWRIWRNSLSSPVVETELEEKTALCRNLRGFVCFKAPETVVEIRQEDCSDLCKI